MRLQQFIFYFIIIIVLTISLSQKTIQMEQHHGQNVDQTRQTYQHHGLNVDQTGQTYQHHGKNVDQTGQTYQHHGLNVNQTTQSQHYDQINQNQLNYSHYQPDQKTKKVKTLNSNSLKRAHSADLDSPQKKSNNDGHFADQSYSSDPKHTLEHGQAYLNDQQHLQIVQNVHDQKNEQNIDQEAVTMSRHNHHPSFDVWDQFILEESLLMGPNPEEVLLQEEDDYLVPNPFAIASLQDQLPNQYFDEFTPGHTVPKDKTESSSSHTVDSSNESNPDFMLAHKNLRILKIKLQEAEINHSLSPTTVLNPGTALNSPMLRNLSTVSNSSTPNSPMLRNLSTVFNSSTPNSPMLRNLSTVSNSSTPNSPMLRNLSTVSNSSTPNSPMLRNLSTESNSSTQNSPMLRNLSTESNSSTQNSPMLRSLSAISNSSTPNSPMLQSLSTLSNSSTPNSPMLRNLSTLSNSSTPNSPMLQSLSAVSNSSTPNSPMLRNLSSVSNSSTPNSPMLQNMSTVSNSLTTSIAASSLRNLSTVINSSTGKVHVWESLTTVPQSTVSTMMSPLSLSASACNTQKNKCTTTVSPSTVTILNIPSPLDATYVPTRPMNTVPIFTAPNSMRTLAINTPVNLLPMGQSTTVPHATVPNSLRPLSFDGQTLNEKLDVAKLTTELAKLTIISTISPLFNTNPMDYDLKIILKMNLACLIINNSELNMQQIPENAANSSFGCATKTTFLEIFSQSIGEHFGEHKEHVPSVIRNAYIYLKIYKKIYKMHTGVEITKDFLKKSVNQLVVLLTEWQKRMPTNGPVQIEDTIFQNEFFKKHCEHLNKKY